MTKPKYPKLREIGFLVPKIVSSSPTHEKFKYHPHATRAFVPIGTRLEKGLSPSEKYLELKQLARNADFYIKGMSARQRRIREKLVQNGVLVEDEMIRLNRPERSLIGRSSFALGSNEGLKLFAKNPAKYIHQIEKAVVTMHALGIRHNHIHRNNFGITADGKAVFLMDFKKAREFNIEKLPPFQLFRMLVRDNSQIAYDLGEAFAEAKLRARNFNFEDSMEPEAQAGNRIKEAVVNEMMSMYPQPIRSRLLAGYKIARRKTIAELRKNAGKK
ncbi:MAG: hypothetical protein V1847_04135 [Candidatus Diapherotrites archaeon]